MSSFLKENIIPEEIAICIEDGTTTAIYVELDELEHLSDVLENGDLRPDSLILQIKTSLLKTAEFRESLKRLKELTNEFKISLEIREIR